MSLVANVLLDWKIFILGFGILALVSIINTTISILPVGCLTFILCSILVWFTSVCVTFVLLHKLLQKNEPIQFRKLTGSSKVRKKCDLKPNRDRVKMLAQDIDKYFITKWYINISENGDFTEECRNFLEEVITRLAEAQLGVSNKVLLCGMLSIFLKHLKEFRRALKRKEKYQASIEDLYRYSHFCSINSKSKDYFLHQLTTNLLRHFINSDLWNSLPCQILVSVLARKLTTFILNLTSEPEILNYLLLNCLASEAVKEKYELAQYNRVCILEYSDATGYTEKCTHSGKNKIKTIDEPDSTIIANDSDSKHYTKQTGDTKLGNQFSNLKEQTSRIRESRNLELVNEMKAGIDLEKLSILSDPVKIYEAKSCRTTKTYSDSKELSLGVSLGQDPLDAMPVSIENVKSFGKSKFWDSGTIEHFVDEAPTQLLNEVKHTTQSTMEGLKSTIKPISDATVNTLHNIKDLQETTVNNALHKIGDFQDEAAGVVEGLLDFGRAGLRRGLRLTGLHENIETAKATTTRRQPQKRSTGRSARPETPEAALDSVWMNPLRMESPSVDAYTKLKSNRIHKNDKDKKR